MLFQTYTESEPTIYSLALALFSFYTRGVGQFMLTLQVNRET